ncbi:cyanophycinase [Segetibacter sp. 3557_3]|uniref:cyanophycinase n=1 Tax=Segetibacter sp. 3557_3 TaxID=2547429 RepID=UPI001058F10C|nr:cyanophycinase [Segetibacter sp. 3557_3]TDH27241.1 cyanophycinase [Segetibacter sp. 3557_3]
MSAINSFGQGDTTRQNQIIKGRPGSLGIIGDTADVKTKTNYGLVLMGGGKDVDEAFKWMIHKSGGGNVVIIRASGTNAYNRYVYRLGNVASVETLKIDTRELANNDTVINIIRNAEMLFIAGGDQSVYMKQWKGTKTADAINYLLGVKDVPVGGTSAGCAILSGVYYSGESRSAVSKEVLSDPYSNQVTLYNNDFLFPPYLADIVTDQHYVARNREGRHVVFMSRMLTDWKILPKGIAADEKTAVCINKKGIATVFGSSKAYFIQTSSAQAPETCLPEQPLTWSHNQKALRVYELAGSSAGNGKFSVKTFKTKKAKGGNWQWWWVKAGELRQTNN